MKVSVDQDVCTGCGLCVNTCPEVFELQGNVAAVKTDVVPEESVDSVKEALQNCPVEAIRAEG